MNEVNNAIIAGINAYVDRPVKQFAARSAAMVLNTPNNIKYSQYGDVTSVRETIAGNSSARGSYNKKTGTGGSVDWNNYRPQAFRQYVVDVDLEREVASIAQGMRPSSELLMESFIDTILPAEFDKIALSNIAATAGKVWINGNDIDVAEGKMISALSKIEAELDNIDPTKLYCCFMRNSAFALLQAEIRQSYGLSALISTQKIKTLIPTVSGVDVIRTCMKIGKVIVIQTPDDRMFSDYLMLSGEAGTPEANGGVVKNTNNTEASEIQMLVVTINADGYAEEIELDNVNAAFASFKINHGIKANPYFQGLNTGELDAYVRTYMNDDRIPFSFGDAGLNQNFDGNRLAASFIMGGSTLKSLKNSVIVVKDAPSAVVEATGLTLSMSGGTNLKVGQVGYINAVVEPFNATDKNVIFSVDSTDAQVIASGAFMSNVPGTYTVTAKVANSEIKEKIDITVA